MTAIPRAGLARSTPLFIRRGGPPGILRQADAGVTNEQFALVGPGGPALRRPDGRRGARPQTRRRSSGPSRRWRSIWSSGGQDQPVIAAGDEALPAPAAEHPRRDRHAPAVGGPAAQHRARQQRHRTARGAARGRAPYRRRIGNGSVGWPRRRSSSRRGVPMTMVASCGRQTPPDAAPRPVAPQHLTARARRQRAISSTAQPERLKARPRSRNRRGQGNEPQRGDAEEEARRGQRIGPFADQAGRSPGCRRG